MSNNDEEGNDDDLYKSVIRFNDDLWERYQWMIGCVSLKLNLKGVVYVLYRCDDSIN